MFRILIVVCLVLMTLTVRAQSDLELIFEANDFVGGLPINQTREIRFSVTNHGPDDFYPSSNPIKIFGSYDYMVSDGNAFRYFSDFAGSDPDCSLAVEHFDPPPPVNNYGLFMWGTIYKAIPAQSSVVCEFNVSIREVALLDMLWQVAHNNDTNTDNNAQQFTFRGLAASVPVNDYWTLLLLITALLIVAWQLSIKQQANSSSE